MLALALAVTLLAFLLPQLTGADPARAVIRARTAEAAPDAATVERLTGALGLDRPLPVQYADFLGRLVRGELGVSFTNRQAVGPQLGRALQVSITLTATAVALAVAVGLLLGTAAAARARSRLDTCVVTACRIAVAVPEFVLAPVLVLLFAVQLSLLPTGGWGSVREAVLPVLTVALFPAALIASLVRTELLEALSAPWIKVSRGKGMPPSRILRQAVRTATTSVTAVASLFLPGLLAGAVVVEVVFGIPGVGRLLYDAVLASDLPVAQAGLVAVVLLAITVSLLGDVLRSALDPRLRR